MDIEYHENEGDEVSDADRYYAEMTEAWGRVIRDRSKTQSVVSTRGEKPRTIPIIVAAHVTASIVDTVLKALNDSDKRSAP